MTLPHSPLQPELYQIGCHQCYMHTGHDPQDRESSYALRSATLASYVCALVHLILYIVILLMLSVHASFGRPAEAVMHIVLSHEWNGLFNSHYWPWLQAIGSSPLARNDISQSNGMMHVV